MQKVEPHVGAGTRFRAVTPTKTKLRNQGGDPIPCELLRGLFLVNEISDLQVQITPEHL